MKGDKICGWCLRKRCTSKYRAEYVCHDCLRGERILLSHNERALEREMVDNKRELVKIARSLLKFTA